MIGGTLPTDSVRSSRPAAERPGVALVCTVRNEATCIGALLDALAAQTQLPDAVYFVDGASTDDTVARIRAHALGRRVAVDVVSLPCTIAAGRNHAIRRAVQEVIVTTDAGVSMGPTWLAALTAPFAHPETGLSWGATVAAPQSVFETALAAATLPSPDAFTGVTFRSARNLAFRRAVWHRVGGFPEWLDYGEDAVFDVAVRAARTAAVPVADAPVFFRPRADLRAFVLQYYRYARGDGKAGLLARRHLLRYGVYACVVLAGALGAPAPFWVACGLAGVLYLRRPLLRLPGLWRAGGLRAMDRLRTVLWLPWIRLVGDVAKMAGYPAGLAWRWRGPRSVGEAAHA